MTEEPRTPLTLEYNPEGLEDDHETLPVIVIEPSFEHPGRIFVGIHPLGRIPDPSIQRAGVHLLPEDAIRVYKHLGKLLMEDDELLKVPTDVQERLEAAAARRTRRTFRIRLPKADFRFEFRLGKIAGVIGTRYE